MNNFKLRFYVDPVLNEINFSNENNWMIELINTPEFKCLNRIHQLGVTYIIFPSATHNRLSHSLGAFEIVRRFIKHLNLDKINSSESKHLLCAALLHDLGHGPNSHAFERYTGVNHEEYTKKFILDKNTNIHKILVKHGINPNEVVNILQQKSKNKWATDLIDSQIDGDRMDYLLRDSHYTGASYGIINPAYIINGSVLINNRVCFVMKALAEVENLLLGRFHMYKQIYSNANSIKYEKDSIIKKLLAAYYDESLISVKEVQTQQKVKNNFLEGYYTTKPIDIYHTGRGDEIFMYDDVNKKVYELSEVSIIIKKLMNTRYKFIYQIKIK